MTLQKLSCSKSYLQKEATFAAHTREISRYFLNQHMKDVYPLIPWAQRSVDEMQDKSTYMEKNMAKGVIQYNSTSSAPSFPHLVQLYSEQPHSSFRSTSFTLYHVHIDLLNLDEITRKRVISSDQTILNYVPVSNLTNEKATHRSAQIKGYFRKMNASYPNML